MPDPTLTADAVADAFTTLTPDRPGRFDAMAEAVLAFQRASNPVYGRYCSANMWLPVAAFKHAAVTTFPPGEAERVFESSGTGRGTPSRHYVRRLEVYDRSVTVHWERVFGAGPFALVAHLPHYTERGARSSLLHMADLLVRRYGDDASGFFLDDPSVLHEAARRRREGGAPVVLLGAAFGLLDLAERAAVALPPDTLIIETGGMKTYRRAVDRATLHATLADAFGLERERVWSEYGMCELLSQCYTRGGDVFFPPPWMRFVILDPEDPSREQPEGTPGALALLDLANVHSASALLTEDRAVRRGDGFEVLGRLSGAELRGCNFLIERALHDA